MTAARRAPSVAATGHDRDSIQAPATIQPHGCLLACDAGATRLVRHSANAPGMLGREGAMPGASLAEVLGEQALHDLRNTITTAPIEGPSAAILGLALANGRSFDVAVHRTEGAAIVEFEPAQDSPDPLQRAQAFIGRITGIDDADALIARATRLVHGVLGFDRVVICRFDRDGAGKVVSEGKRPDIDSLLGQRMPASDIPGATALHPCDALRIVSDTHGERVPIVPARDEAGLPLDLSRAHLRSATPGHCAYLESVGAGAAMSIPIIADDRLWGLIACHHPSPRILPMAERAAAELFGQFFSLRLDALRQRRRLHRALRGDGFPSQRKARASNRRCPRQYR